MWAMRRPREEAPSMLLRGLAVGFWPGIALGEAAHGLTRIADTTPTAYCVAQAILAVVVLGVLMSTALTGVRPRLVAGASTAVVGSALYVVYGLA